MKTIKVFAPGSIANLGPAFDILGVALGKVGDFVEVTENSHGEMRILEIEGASRQLPFEPEKNAVTLGFMEIQNLLGMKFSVDIKIKKGMPISGGLGGSSASAVAGVYAASLLSGKHTEKEDILSACVNVESIISGFHADNVAPSLLGGFVLINSYKPLSVIKLGSIENLYFAVAHPDFELETKKSRQALPKQIELGQHIFNSSKAASLIAAIARNNIRLFGESIQDIIIEPARANLIPGFYGVKKAALDAGAYGSSISGSGPSIFAVTDDESEAQNIGNAMQEAFAKNNL